MKLMAASVLPLSTVRPRFEHRSFSVPVSFAAGVLIGIPLTYFILILTVDNPYTSHRAWVDGGSRRFSISHSPVASLFRLPSVSSTSDSRKTDLTKDLPLISSILVKPDRKVRIIPSHSSDLLVKSVSSNNESTNVSKPFKLDDIVDGVYWTALSERFVPRGFDDYDIKLWKRFLNSTDVLKVEEGCGRMQNRLVTLAEGGKSCCRYRHNNDQIQGEIFSFYLGRLLGIRNLSPSSLALVDARTRRWSSAASQIALAQWSSERPVVLTQFVENLQPAYIPQHFREKDKRRLHPIFQDLGNLTASDISELVQWTDLVVFDYLTANLDRVVNNLYNERWNPGMMKQPTHNLAKTPEGLLLFLDNESGLLHGYRLLEKYEHFHRALLDGLCVFKKDTVDAVDKLHHGNVGHLLKKSFLENDPGMFDWLPFLPDRSLKTLRKRIAHVHEHIRTCKSRFAPDSVVLEAPIIN
ncbi:extracellular serine/threonine protein kinase four-jointed-like [Argiope bruennichi]|uniref:extracellular serine/threonine protein kinase four-jointed-like n=1 Tax=Argiope bruennichi TaxID=94029 RepID=UPI0024957AD0|nr:extracellular serine/threonine protein kinase four-jointed-like [Argiope bruennichi]